MHTIASFFSRGRETPKNERDRREFCANYVPPTDRNVRRPPYEVMSNFDIMKTDLIECGLFHGFIIFQIL